MAFCAYCGHEISDMAAACPSCGHPNELRAPIPRAVAAGYASFGRRLGALLLDGVILSLVLLPIIRPHNVRSQAEIFNPARLIVAFAYRWLMLSFANGQTLGKMALGIRIMNPDRTPLTVAQAALREGMAIISGAVIALGYLWAAWDPENRTWHDMVANTRAFRVV